MSNPLVIADQKRLELTVNRLAHELVEIHDDFKDTCLIGIQQSGVQLATRIHKKVQEITGLDNILFGKLDVTFYRDDFRMKGSLLKAHKTEMDFLVDGKKVVLIDDVLYTGRTIRSSLTALQHYGRPDLVELLCLVDRRYLRHLPIKANYSGFKVDALDEAYVKVIWGEENKDNQILLYSNKEG